MKKNDRGTSVTANDQQLSFISKLKEEWWKMAVTQGVHYFHPDLYFVVSAQSVSELAMVYSTANLRRIVEGLWENIIQQLRTILCFRIAGPAPYNTGMSSCSNLSCRAACLHGRKKGLLFSTKEQNITPILKCF